MKPAWRLLCAACPFLVLMAQDLAPRAYLITPVNSNAVTLTWLRSDGSVNLNGAIPVTGASGAYNVPALSYYHSFNLLGRSANVIGSLPYAVGTFTGEALGAERQAYRSGLLDASFRVSVNLKGGPAMPVKEFLKWHEKLLLGASFKVLAPTGQYDPGRFVNWGINRWAFKPEFGYSQRWGHWVLDGYAGVWFYTTNNAFPSIPRPVPQTQQPIGSFEGHFSYDFNKPGAWISLDGNYWFGGVSELNGLSNPATRQVSSRLGATASIPLIKHQSIKVSYSGGTYVRYGGNYQSMSVAWQYSWIGTHFR